MKTIVCTFSIESAEEEKSNFLLGGITIPERHQISQNEHLRVVEKIALGCSFCRALA